MKVDNLQALIFVLVVFVSAGSAVYATSPWTVTNNLRVTRADLAVYLDSSLTEAVPDPLDWGEARAGTRIGARFWIRNEASVTIRLSWSSDLSASSSISLRDSWVYYDGQSYRDITGYALSVSETLETLYIVEVSPSTGPSTHSWQLSLGGS